MRGRPTLSNLLFFAFSEFVPGFQTSVSTSSPKSRRSRFRRHTLQESHTQLLKKQEPPSPVHNLDNCSVGTTISLAQPWSSGYPLLCRCTKICGTSTVLMTSHHQSLVNLIKANEEKYAWSSRSGLLHASPAFTRCVRHQLSLLNTTRSTLTRIVSTTRSTSCPSSTESTGLAQHRVQPPRHVSGLARHSS